MAGFRNNEYRDEWLRLVPGTEREYADGTYFEEGDAYAVYDGAQNWVGAVNKDGTFTGNGAPSEYKDSFLRTAKAELVRLGLIEEGET